MSTGPKVNKQGKIKYLLKESESVKGTLWLKKEKEMQEALEKPLENREEKTSKKTVSQVWHRTIEMRGNMYLLL